MKIKVDGKPPAPSYTVTVRRGALSDIGRIVGQRPTGKLIVLTNTTVQKLWFGRLRRILAAAGRKSTPIVINDGERYKTRQTYQKIIARLIDLGADRQSILITLGGGVVGDLGGFVAATYLRGIDLVHIPTTLVAQIDSSIGGKTAIDLPRAKNMLGSFYNPRQVLIDPELLSTLPDEALSDGLFEAIKTGLVCNKNLFAYIVDHLDEIRQQRPSALDRVVRGTVHEKAKVVSVDPFDRNRRAILNFGHTLGHALETAAGYRKISHGVAVGWGMLAALELSHLLGYGERRVVERAAEPIRDLLERKRFPQTEVDQLWQTIKLDKKVQGGKVRFVLLKAIGRPVIDFVDRRTVFKALERIRK